MPYGKNATIVTYDLFNQNEEKVSVRILPLVNSRHFHLVTDKDELTWGFIQEPFEQGVIIQPSIPMSTLIIVSTDGQYSAKRGEWVEEMLYRVDESRGESCLDDNFLPGHFSLNVYPGERKKFYILATAGKSLDEAQGVLSSITKEPGGIDALHGQELERRRSLLTNFRKCYFDVEMEHWLKWLILATDSFLVDRKSTETKSVIAGYHWFEDWGRDTMISLPGLTLITGRFEDAKQILRTFKHYCLEGIIPNRFPDRAGEEPVYNTVDATLWYFNAVLQYLKYTSDFVFVQEELWDVLQSIVEHHVQGTIYEIRMDEDGLIEHGPQLTWMDVMVNGCFVTPREGKAVEIQALWYNALKIMGLLAKGFKQKEEAKRYSAMAEKAKKSFMEEFWNQENGCLFDVVCREGKDASLRPNQVIAVALDFSLLDETRGRAVVETVWRKLWGTFGLKTLSEDDPRYVGKYLGDRFRRDNAYHNGTVWAWLIGPFVTAFLKVKNYEENWRTFAFKNFLKPLFQEGISNILAEQ